MSEDFAWFKEHYAEFQDKYGRAFIVIKDKKVLGVYETYAEGVRNTARSEELGTFIVQECNPQYEAYNCYIFSSWFFSSSNFC